MATLGERIKEERIARKMTQTDLGNICGVTKYTVSLYENNKSTPNDDIKKTLADFFNVSIDYLLGRENTKDTTNVKIKPIIDTLDRAGDLQDEDIDEIREQVEFLINLKRKKKSNS